MEDEQGKARPASRFRQAEVRDARVGDRDRLSYKMNPGTDGGEPHRRKRPMRTIMALVITGALAGAFTVSVADSASAAKVVTKYGTYEGGCSGSSCLYKARKAPKKAQMRHKTS